MKIEFDPSPIKVILFGSEIVDAVFTDMGNIPSPDLREFVSCLEVNGKKYYSKFIDPLSNERGISDRRFSVDSNNFLQFGFEIML